MRKFNKKNKTFFWALSVFAVLLLTVIVIFTIQQFNRLKIKYDVKAVSYVYDEDKTLVKVTKDSYIKKNVLSNYYLIYNDEKIDLYENPVVYNETEQNLTLLGTFYEVYASGEVKKLTEENVINDFNTYHIYKISDRRYLITGKNISSSTNTFTTNNYVLIDLDKIGNGYLYNNEVNMKTFETLTIVTSEFSFNVNEEILYINNEEVNLANINGSTNNYVKKEETTTEDDTQVQDIVVTKNAIITQHNEVAIARKTTILNLQSGVNQISFDYLFYDPFEEYKNLYVMYTNTLTNETLRKDLSLDINDMQQGSITIENLNPNTTYNLVFYYTYNINGEDKSQAFDNYTMTTKNISGAISIEKISGNVVQYKVKIDDYSLSDCYISLSSNGSMLRSEQINLIGKSYEGSISLSGASKNDLITLNLANCYYEGKLVDVNASYKFKL